MTPTQTQTQTLTLTPTPKQCVIMRALASVYNGLLFQEVVL